MLESEASVSLGERRKDKGDFCFSDFDAEPTATKFEALQTPLASHRDSIDHCSLPIRYISKIGSRVEESDFGMSRRGKGGESLKQNTKNSTSAPAEEKKIAALGLPRPLPLLAHVSSSLTLPSLTQQRRNDADSLHLQPPAVTEASRPLPPAPQATRALST